jgi:hypothetical protein
MVRTDRGDIVLGWLTRLAVALAVVAVLGFDAVQVGLANVQLQDQANDAAAAARDAYAGHHDIAAAVTAAQSSARAENVDDVLVPSSLVVAHDGSITLKLTRPIHTVVAHYLPVDGFKTVTSAGSATVTVG